MFLKQYLGDTMNAKLEYAPGWLGCDYLMFTKRGRLWAYANLEMYPGEMVPPELRVPYNRLNRIYWLTQHLHEDKQPHIQPKGYVFFKFSGFFGYINVASFSSIHKESDVFEDGSRSILISSKHLKAFGHVDAANPGKASNQVILEQEVSKNMDCGGR